MVRCLVNAELDRIFAAKRRQIWSPPEGLPWWKDEPEPSFETRIALRDLNRGRRELERSILGESSDPYRGSHAVDGLPAEKRKAADEILRDYDDLLASVCPSYLRAELMTESMILKRRLLLEEREKDLALICDPREAALVNILSSPRGDCLLMDLNSVALSDQELVQLGDACRASAADIKGPSLFTDEALFEKTISSILGPQRCATVMMESSGDYLTAMSICRDLGLPKANAKETFNLTRALAQHLKEIVSRSDLELADMRTEIAKAAQNTELQLLQILGNEGGRKFLESARYIGWAKGGGYFTVKRLGYSSWHVSKGMKP